MHRCTSASHARDVTRERALALHDPHAGWSLGCSRTARDVTSTSSPTSSISGAGATTIAARSTTWSSPARTPTGSSLRLLFSDVISTQRWLPPGYSEWGRPKKSGRSTASAHLCKTRARERCSDHVALPTPRPLLAQGDDRHLWSLGTRGAKASGGQDGGRIPDLTMARAEPCCRAAWRDRARR